MKVGTGNRSKELWCYFGVFAFACLVFFLVVRSGDDLGRAMQFRDRAAVPGALLGSVRDMHQTLNGRIVGNAMHLFLVDFVVIGLLVKATITTTIVWTIARLTKIRSLALVPLLTLLVLAPSAGMFKQVTVWAAGYFNYVPSVCCILLALLIIRDGKRMWSIPAVAVLAVVGSLFSENVTLTLLLAAIGLTVFSVKARAFMPRTIALLVGSVLGAVIMFSSPVYRKISEGEDTYRQLAIGKEANDQTSFLSRIANTFDEVARFAALEPASFYLLIAIVFLVATQFWKKSRTQAALSIGTVLLALVLFLVSNLKFDGLSDRSLFVMNAVVVCLLLSYFGLMAVALISLRTRSSKIAAAWVAGGLVLFLPFLVVSPFGPRNMYFTSICLIVAILVVFSDALNMQMKNVNFKMATLSAFAVLAALMIALLGLNKVVEAKNFELAAQVEVIDTRLVLNAYPVPTIVHDGKNARKMLLAIPQCAGTKNPCADLEIVWE